MVRQIVQRSHATASTCRSGNEGGGARFADPGDPARNGRAHGMVSGQPLPAQQALTAPELLVAYPDRLAQEPFAMGLRKGDVDTLNFLNNWIAREQASGWIQERYHYWFETMDWQNLVQ